MLFRSLPDETRLEVPEGASGLDVARAIGEGLARAALGIKVDGELRDLSAPVPDGAEIDRHVLGALGIAQILGEAGIVFGAGASSDAVDGWGGDQYVAWLDGDRACLRANIVGDTPEDTVELADALAEFAADPPFSVEASVEATADLVTLTSCG